MTRIRAVGFLLFYFAVGVPTAFADSDEDLPWLVHRATLPEPMVLDNLPCHATAVPGRDGLFLYIPDEVMESWVAWFSNENLPDGSSTTIEAGGRKWKMTKTGNTMTYGLVERPRQGDSAVVLVAIVVAIVFLLAYAYRSNEKANSRRAAESARKRLIAEVAERERKSEEQRAAAIRENALREQQQALEAAQREHEEKLARARSSLEGANQMMQEVPRKDGPRAVAKYLRESYLFDQALGEWISVIRIINPDLNGNVEFRWKVTRDMPPSTSIQILRGSRPVRGEFALEGTLKEQITPGRRASYRFSVFVGSERRGNPVLMEVKVPDPKEWSLAATGDEDDVRERYRRSLDRRLVLEELRAQAVAEVNAKEVSDDLRSWMLGVVDSVTAEFQEEG